MKSIGRMGWTVLGCICLAVGTIGTIVPVIPTVPLYFATAFCFAKGSKRLHDWFEGSEFHRKHLKPFMERRALPLRSKAIIMTGITAVMGIGFAMMDGLVIPRIIVAGVWAFHVWYFAFHIKTAPAHARTDAA